MKKKEVIVCILALVVLIFSATNVLAAPMNMDTDDEQPSILDENDVNNNITNEQGNQTGNRIQNVKDENVLTVRNENTVKDGNGMPNTGIEDLPIIAIGICVVSAAVAFTQIRRYNV